MIEVTFRSVVQKLTLILPVVLLLLAIACGGDSGARATLSSEQAILVAEQIDSICLEVEEDVLWYEEGDVAVTLEELFTRLGLSVMQPGDSCDLSLALRISGRSQELQLITYYQDNEMVGQETIEPWASATGELTFMLDGYETISHNIDNRGVGASDVDFYPEVLEQVAILWGPEVYRHSILIPDLEAIARDKLIELGDEGVRILGQLYLDADPAAMYEVWMAFQMLEPDEAVEAVPYLIAALGDGKGRLVRPEDMLRGITGEEFGRDANAWTEWWQDQ